MAGVDLIWVGYPFYTKNTSSSEHSVYQLREQI